MKCGTYSCTTASTHFFHKQFAIQFAIHSSLPYTKFAIRLPYISSVYGKPFSVWQRFAIHKIVWQTCLYGKLYGNVTLVTPMHLRRNKKIFVACLSVLSNRLCNAAFALEVLIVDISINTSARLAGP